MNNFVHHYNTARRSTSPCAAYRAATTAAAPRTSKHPIVRTVTAWAVAAALTLGMGALAAHESAATTSTTTGQP